MSEEPDTEIDEELEDEEEIEEEETNLDTRIENAKKDFKNQFMVAFLGEKYSGKTVACALIKEALTRHYEKYSKGEWIGIGTEGSKRMNQLTDKLTNGQFPAKTLLDEATPMTLEIVSPSQSKKIEIVLRDMAGEKRKDLFEEDFSNIDKRLDVIFNTATIDGKDYGLLAHVVFAKMYLIVIDCSKFNDVNKIRMEESYIKDTIRRLWDIKNRVGELTHDMIHDPFAFVFTKYDLLPPDMQKSPEELMDELPEVTNALKRYHKGETAYFKSSVKSVLRSEKEIQDAIKEKGSSENEDLKNVESNKKYLEEKKEEIKKELDETNESLATLKKKLEEEIRPTGVEADIGNAEEEVSDVEEERNSSQEEYDDITVQLDIARKQVTRIKQKIDNRPPITAEDADISKYKPIKPLEYSLDDYLQLIEWIIKMHKQIIRF